MRPRQSRLQSHARVMCLLIGGVNAAQGQIALSEVLIVLWIVLTLALVLYCGFIVPLDYELMP